MDDLLEYLAATEYSNLEKELKDVRAEADNFYK
jgi:hypothetical protein